MSLKRDLGNAERLLRKLYAPLIQLGGHASSSDASSTDKTLEGSSTFRRRSIWSKACGAMTC
jgi:hypothetical protein